MTAISTFHPREAVMEDPAVQETVNHLFDIGSQKTVLACKPLVIGLFQRLKVVFNTLIVLRLLRLAGLVDRGCAGQFPSPCKRLKTNPTRNTVNLTESQWPGTKGREEIVLTASSCICFFPWDNTADGTVFFDLKLSADLL